jgi:hypothetical protein
MRNRIITLGLFSMVMIVALSAFFNAGGSHGAKTGSPTDVNNCTQCHSGTAQTAISWISTDIPASGYLGGQTYTITIQGTHASVVKFGFELTAEDANNDKVGTFTITNATETKLVNSSHAITHNGNGITPDNDSIKSWSFDWTAPAVGTGNIKFYAALLAANGNMSTSGDVTYLTSLEVVEDVANEINNSIYESNITIYPSIVNEYINIKTQNISPKQITIYNINGQLVMSKRIDGNSSISRLNLASLNSGNYIITFEINGNLISKRFIKN